MEKRGQLTVFMILGLVILFVVIFTFMLYSNLEKTKINLGKETAITKVFKKEGFRIYVEDCLSDELEKGLILIGKQGTLWSDQPGGRKTFNEFNGVQFQDDRVAYGISQLNYLQFQNAFPCRNDSFPTEFCQYSYPNSLVRFGDLKLKLDTLENDFKRYMINRTVWCVQNFTLSNISQYAEFEYTEVNLASTINDDGITIKAEYPLRFSIGGEEVFHLSTFDFFYPTKFRQLVESAVLKPLEFDWKYVDFNYTKSTLETPPSFSYGSDITGGDCEISDRKFQCQRSLFYDKYFSLSVQMQNQSLSNGDDVFIFKSPFPNIVKVPGEYEFKIARQNRPPALDYVNRSQCIIPDDPLNSYDYLVIPDQEEYGDINISLFALDADEDTVKYEFIVPNVPLDNSLLRINQKKPDSENNFNVSGSEEVLPAQRYTLTALATDGHGLQDIQNIRILVDRPINPVVSLLMKDYSLRTGGELQSYESIFSGTNRYWVSIEDPIFLEVTLPEESLAPIGTAEAHISYISPQQSEPELVSLTSQYLLDQNKFEFNLPWYAGQQAIDPLFDIDDYDENDLLNWFGSDFDFNFFKDVTDKGQLRVDFNFNYCGSNLQQSSFQADIVVTECIPHYNPTHPYPYIPDDENKYYEFTSEEVREPINPFLATHACCTAAGGLVSEDEEQKDRPCFINPDPGCYNNLEEEDGARIIFPGSPSSGYVWETEVRLCGDRGNICDGNYANTLYHDTLWCGKNEGANACSKVHDQCQDVPAFSYVDTDNNGENDGWCNGKMGCELPCTGTDGVVYLTPDNQRSFSSEMINAMATDAWWGSFTPDLEMPQFPFQCGCNQGSDGKPCDLYYDGSFDEICLSGSCKPIVCRDGSAQWCDTEGGQERIA